MSTTVEVVGTSQKDFLEAIQQAVDQLAKKNEKIHSINVTSSHELAGDYKVTIKARIDLPKAGECPTCLNPAGKSGHLCIPHLKREEKCSWCGALIPDERHLCNDKIKELAYICNTCGRTAVSTEHLCSPRKIS